MHNEVKETEVSEFEAEKDLLMERAPTSEEKMGDPGLSQIYLAGLMEHRTFQGRKDKEGEVSVIQLPNEISVADFPALSSDSTCH